MKSVIVLNHFAVPRGQAGGTRHVELFDQLPDDWRYTVVGADRNLLSGARSHQTSGAYSAVRTTPYRGNGTSRILNWLSYGVGAFLLGIRQRRVDVVYASSPHLLAGLAGYLIARVRRAVFVLEIRDLWPRILVDMGRMKSTSPVYRLLRRLELFLYCHADEIVVLAEGSIKAIRADCPSADPITFIPNGSDTSMFAADSDRDASRERFRMTGLVFVYAGAHGPANGLDLVLDAAEHVKGDLPEVSFLLVGDGVEKTQLVEQATRRGLANVNFHGPIPKSDMPNLLAASDVGLHVLADVPLFRYGVSPNKLFDYMAAGLPVVTNCPGEVENLVNDAHAGVAVGPGELERAVRDVVGVSDEQRGVWGASGREFIERYRSREVLGRQLAQVLDRAVKN
jgi:glycosyltransferase involved in cell wall biosynthesis